MIYYHHRIFSPTFLTILVIQLTLGIIDVQAADVQGCGFNANRLAHFYIPEHYDLTLEPDLDKQHFYGKVDIFIKYTGEAFSSSASPLSASGGGVSKKSKVSKKSSSTSSSLRSSWGRACLNMLTCGSPTDANYRKIVLNVGLSLDVEGAKLTSLDENGQADGLSFEIDDICRDNQSQMLVLTVSRKLKKQAKFKLEISFRGPLTSRYAGPLISSIDNQQLTSDLFPSRARFAFPSFDQPDMRATYALTLIHNNNMESISSSRLVSETSDSSGNKKIVKFERTKPLPSYGLALAIASRFNRISCRAEGVTKPVVTAYVPESYHVEDAKIILETVCASIPSIERYLRVPFPLHKLDLTTSASKSHSSDSSNINEENNHLKKQLITKSVGLLIFDKNYLLFKNDNNNIFPNEQLALAIRLAIEGVLNQWIGCGLIVSQWWDDYWLLEGFTLWRSYKLANELRPEFDYQTNFLLDIQTRALDSMARANTNLLTIKQDVSTLPQRIGGVFIPNDAIQSVIVETNRLQQSQAYLKAASLFSMLSNEIGEILLRDIWSQLMNQNEWSSINLQQFQLESENIIRSKSFESIIESYIYANGVPLISVKRIDRENIVLTQELVTINNESNELSQSKSAQLIIPIKLIVSNGDNKQETIRAIFDGTKSSTFKIKLPLWFDAFNSTHWLKLNHQFSGLYRTSYDADLFKKLRTPISERKMSVYDRINILDDSKALVEMGKITVRDLESLLLWFQQETDGQILSSLCSSIVPLLSVKRFELSESFETIILKLFEHIYVEQRFKVENIENGQSVNSSHSLAQLNGRRDALTALIQFAEHRAAIEEAVYLFESTEPETGEQLEEFLLKPVFSAIIIRGSHEQQFEQLLRRLQLIETIQEREQLVNHLIKLIPDKEDERRTRLLATL